MSGLQIGAVWKKTGTSSSMYVAGSAVLCSLVCNISHSQLVRKDGKILDMKRISVLRKTRKFISLEYFQNYCSTLADTLKPMHDEVL